MRNTLAEIRSEFRAGFPDSRLSIAPPGQKVPILQHLRKPGLDEAEAVFIARGCESLPGSQISLSEFLLQFNPPPGVSPEDALNFLRSDTVPGSAEPLELTGDGGAEIVVWGGANSQPAVRLSSLGSTAIKEERQLNNQEAAEYQGAFHSLTAVFFGLGNDELREQMRLSPEDILVRIPDDCFASLVDGLALDRLILELSKKLGAAPPTAVVIQGDAASLQSLSLFDEYTAMYPDRLFRADVARIVGGLSGPDSEGHHANYLMTAAEIGKDCQSRDFAAGDYGENGQERDWDNWQRTFDMSIISRFRLENPGGELKPGETLVLANDNNRSLSITLKNGGFMVEAARRAARAARGLPLEDTGTRIIGDGKRLDGINPETNKLETGAALSGLTKAISQFLLQTTLE